MKFKNQLVAERWSGVHPKLREIASDADKFMQDNFGIEIVITESATTPEEDKRVGRVSITHRDKPWGRALDMRTAGVSPHALDMLKIYLNGKYGTLGAVVIDKVTNKPINNLIVDKKHGTGPHWHVQIKRGIPA